MGGEGREQYGWAEERNGDGAIGLKREEQEGWRGIKGDLRRAGEPSQESKAHWISLDPLGITQNPPNVVAAVWGALNLLANNKLFFKHHWVMTDLCFSSLFSTFLRCRGQGKINLMPDG